MVLRALAGALSAVTILALPSQSPAQAPMELTALDYVEIQQLVAKYARAIDTCSNNGYDYADLYTSDGIFLPVINGSERSPVQGREALAEVSGGGSNNCENVGWIEQGVHHIYTNHIITPTSEGATGTVDMLMIGLGGDPNKIEHDGYYEDSYVKTSDGWRFKQRTHHATYDAATRPESAPYEAAGAASPTDSDPLVFDTWVPGPCSPNGQPQGQCPPGDLFRVQLVPVAEGLRAPRHIAFTPDGDLLITELAAPSSDPRAGSGATSGLPGHVRIVRDGVLEAEPVAGWPAPGIESGALWSIVVHPDFADNRLVYLYYVKKGADDMVTRALARARLDDMTLNDIEEIFVAEPWIPGGPMAGRAAFGPDGAIYLTVNDHVEHDDPDSRSEPLLAQQLDNHIGKVLRLRDDGGIPADNPFVGREDAAPEVFTYGQRNVTDFAWHPETGDLWTTEISPMGGDEINILHSGRNYGWPLVSLGKNYNQTELSENHWYRPGMDMPVMYWTPSISPSTLAWYTGDALGPWQGHLFVGALNGQTLVRVAFDQPMPQQERRDSLFIPLGRRWRHVVQGPDGYLYALTVKRTLGGTPDPDDATSGVVYRIEPAAAPPDSAGVSDSAGSSG